MPEPNAPSRDDLIAAAKLARRRHTEADTQVIRLEAAVAIARSQREWLLEAAEAAERAAGLQHHDEI